MTLLRYFYPDDQALAIGVILPTVVEGLDDDDLATGTMTLKDNGNLE
ncbi:hypothetical protein SLEP1_g5074 [Rubroshorea leprosula]|uniref:DUF2283 domain-containing protein n=1 Tax=Rubroshorea leprosula TaxID=152421 RepID=A0AAV5I1C6_9ROSI|nr:hypothetical protein SLEP1_g5074 [Rubroshorea leprosula]